MIAEFLYFSALIFAINVPFINDEYRPYIKLCPLGIDIVSFSADIRSESHSICLDKHRTVSYFNSLTFRVLSVSLTVVNVDIIAHFIVIY